MTLAAVMNIAKAMLTIGVTILSLSCATSLRHAPEFIELYEDSAGHTLETRAVHIYADGAVSEERYDFISGGPVHLNRRLRTLSAEQLGRLRALLQEQQFRTLPSNLSLDPKTGLITVVPDAPFRSISVTADGARQSVSTNDVRGDNEGETYQRFRAIWNGVLSEVRP